MITSFTSKFSLLLIPLIKNILQSCVKLKHWQLACKFGKYFKEILNTLASVSLANFCEIGYWLLAQLQVRKFGVSLAISFKICALYIKQKIYINMPNYSKLFQTLKVITTLKNYTRLSKLSRVVEQIWQIPHELSLLSLTLNITLSWIWSSFIHWAEQTFHRSLLCSYFSFFYSKPGLGGN